MLLQNHWLNTGRHVEVRAAATFSRSCTKAGTHAAAREVWKMSSPVVSGSEVEDRAAVIRAVKVSDNRVETCDGLSELPGEHSESFGVGPDVRNDSRCCAVSWNAASVCAANSSATQTEALQDKIPFLGTGDSQLAFLRQPDQAAIKLALSGLSHSAEYTAQLDIVVFKMCCYSAGCAHLEPLSWLTCKLATVDMRAT